MVKPNALLVLAAAAALLGAVGIGPRREGVSGTGGDEERPRRIRPAYSAPAAAAPGPVTIAPRIGGAPAPRFTHRFDGRVHWYGYPYGAGYYWLRPFGGFWWTWDARFSRWVYWNDGFWWWPGPDGAQFVYLRDDYYPYEAVRNAGYAAPAAASAGARGAWTSPDGRRLVEVSGPDAQAVLYDKTGDAPAYVRLLGKGARKVRFTAATPSLPPTIAVESSNGSIALFDYDGRRLDAAKPGAVKEAPPAAEAPSAAPPGLPPPPAGLPAPD
jgi:hypothetical protein